MRSRFLLPVAALFVLACWPERALGCSCIRSGPPCQEFSTASAAFVGVVTEGGPAPKIQSEDGRSFHYGKRTFTFTVEEAFGGVEGTRVVIHTGSGGGDCGYDFKVGTRYIVYAYRSKDDNQLWASICSRTRPASAAAEDLEYLRHRAGSAPGATVSGGVQRYRLNVRGEGAEPVGPLAGATVVVEGEGRRLEALTDPQGHFRLAGVPPGTYKVTLLLPDELTTDREREVKLADRGCAVLSFQVYDNGRVSGRVADAQGRPVPKISLQLIPADGAGKENPHAVWAEADDEGRFEFKAVAQGRYLLGVRLRGWASPDSPDAAYPPTYHPGVADASQAVVITVVEGQSVTGRDLRLPPRLAERVITGTVVFADGRPAAKAQVALYETTYSAQPTGYGSQADERGRFSLKAHEGLSYFVSAHVNLPDGRGSRQMHAEPVDIPATGGDSEIRLVVSEPDGTCARCRERLQKKAGKKPAQ